MSKHKSSSRSSKTGLDPQKAEAVPEDMDSNNGSASPEPGEIVGESKKRKQSDNDADEIEIDVSAPEPLSKKALRQAKKQKLDSSTGMAGMTKEGKSGSTGVGENDDEILSKALEDTPNKRSAYGIWIGNLPFAVNKAQLREFLISKSTPTLSEDEITRIHIPAPSNNAPARAGIKPKNKGFAYVDFSSEIGLKAALLLSETSFGGRRVLIKDAKSFEGRPDKSEDQAQDKSNNGTADEKILNEKQTKRIFVGNLGFDVTREDLQEHFVQCGALAHVHVATFEDSGKCKGYAWVTFDEPESAEAAVRGWILKTPADAGARAEDEPAADQEDNKDVEEADEKPSKKTPKPRKWFVNRLFGRMLRCEFAEDPATRYKKRFGKQAKETDKPFTEEPSNQTQPRGKATKSQAKGKGENGTFTDINPGAPTDRFKRRGKTNDQARSGKQDKLPDDVSYRTGAVVTSTGTKTTFD